MTTDKDIAALTIPEQLFMWLRVNMMEIVGAFAVLVIGLLLAGLLSRWARIALSRSSKLDPTVSQFLANMVKYSLWALVLVTVLAQFGVQTTSILAALGGMALAIGLALQGTLSNVASGVMILIQKPFRVGEGITVVIHLANELDRQKRVLQAATKSTSPKTEDVDKQNQLITRLYQKFEQSEQQRLQFQNELRGLRRLNQQLNTEIEKLKTKDKQ